MSFVNKLIDDGTEALGRYYSVYRGMVVENDDPLSLNRLLVAIPEVNDGVIAWANHRNSHGGHLCGFKLFPTPKIGDIVYITFEDGNPALPLWEYHGWALNQPPEVFDDPDICGIITPKGTKILINDRTGEIVLESPCKITLYSDDSIDIGAIGDVNLTAEHTIINGGVNEGMVNINELTEKLNNLVNEVESLRNTFNNHTHSGVTPGGGTTSPTTTQYSRSITQFNKSDYEDTVFTH